MLILGFGFEGGVVRHVRGVFGVFLGEVEFEIFLGNGAGNRVLSVLLVLV